MGITKVTVKIQNLTKSKPGFEGLFLVDIGAIHCMTSASKLIEAGIEKEGSEVYDLKSASSFLLQAAIARHLRECSVFHVSP